MSLQNNFEYLFGSFHSREDTSVSFSALVPREQYLVHKYFLAARMSSKISSFFGSVLSVSTNCLHLSINNQLITVPGIDTDTIHGALKQR